MAQIRHRDREGNVMPRGAVPDPNGTTFLSWRAGGRDGVSRSATFETRGGGRGSRSGWYAFNAALVAEGHPEAPRGWRKSGMRWAPVDERDLASPLSMREYGLTVIRTRFGGNAAYQLQSERAFLTHTAPMFVGMLVRDVTAADVEAWQKSLLPKLSKRSIQTHRSALGLIFKAAVRDKIREDNPLASVASPKGKVRKFHSDAIGADEVPMVLAAARAVDADANPAREPDPHFGDVVELAYLTGLRVGELSAMRVEAYRAAKGKHPAALFVTIGVNVGVVDGKIARGIGGPKTEAGVRTVFLGARGVEIVEGRIAKARGGWLFPAVLKTGPMSATTLARRWATMLEIAVDAGLDLGAPRVTKGGKTRLAFTPHGLRRTHISHRIGEYGHDVATVAESVGHANATTTLNVYTESVSTDADRHRQALDMEALVVPKTARRLRAV